MRIRAFALSILLVAAPSGAAMAQALTTTTPNPFASGGAAPLPMQAPMQAPIPARHVVGPVHIGGVSRPAAAEPAGGHADLVEARRACGSDPVVWVNTGSGIYHSEGDKWFGNTRRGDYMCRAQADASGFRASRSHGG